VACPLARVGELTCCSKKYFLNVSINLPSKELLVCPVVQVMFGITRLVLVD